MTLWLTHKRNSGSILNLLYMVCAWYYSSVVGLIMVLLVVFICSNFSHIVMPSSVFHYSVKMIIYAFCFESLGNPIRAPNSYIILNGVMINNRSM